MTAILDRPLSPCAPVANGTGCPRLTLTSTTTTTTTTTTTPSAGDGCALTGGNCPSDQATIDTCPEC